MWPTGFDTKMFPVELASRHPELATARLFTSDQWADYLLFANYPRQRVFYDDRAAGLPLVRFACCKRAEVIDEAVTRLKGLAP
jgi:N-succinyldiaminopimelate aminotransferase